jgi:hypothetical protein
MLTLIKLNVMYLKSEVKEIINILLLWNNNQIKFINFYVCVLDLGIYF